MYILRVALICAAAALAYDLSKRNCPTSYGSGLCLTSFRWCSYLESSSGAAGAGCSPPAEGGYLRGTGPTNAGSIFAVLIFGNTYNVSWKKATPDDYPVRVQWYFDQPGKDYLDPQVDTRSAKWEINTTESFFMFKPDDILRQFPTPLAQDLDSDMARSLAKADLFQTIRISQPEHPLAGVKNKAPQDSSQNFVMQEFLFKGFFDTQAATARDKEQGKWAKGVGIGVGVGVPVLMAAAALVGWSFGKKRGRRVVAKP